MYVNQQLHIFSWYEELEFPWGQDLQPSCSSSYIMGQLFSVSSAAGFSFILTFKSILGPLIFSIHILSLDDSIEAYGLNLL